MTRAALYEYVYQIVRVPIKPRTRSTDKYIHGAIISVPVAWYGKTVNLHLEADPSQKLVGLPVKGAEGVYSHVYMPKEWVGKAGEMVVAELVEEKKRKN